MHHSVLKSFHGNMVMLGVPAPGRKMIFRGGLDTNSRVIISVDVSAFCNNIHSLRRLEGEEGDVSHMPNFCHSAQSFFQSDNPDYNEWVNPIGSSKGSPHIEFSYDYPMWEW